MKNVAYFLLIFAFLIIFNRCNTTNHRNSFERNDVIGANVSQLSGITEFNGWIKNSIGEWISYENRLSVSASDQNNNLLSLTIYEVQFNNRNYYLLETSHYHYSSGQAGWFAGIFYPGGTSSTNIRKQFYIINPNRMRIRLRENRITDNTINFIQRNRITWDGNNIQDQVTNVLLSQNRESGRFNFYTLYLKDENVVRFYLKHYLGTSILTSGRNVLLDYYYEIDYQVFIEAFGKWIY